MNNYLRHCLHPVIPKLTYLLTYLLRMLAVRPHIEELMDIQQEEFQQAVLQCRSKGSPPLHMTFHKVGDEAPYQIGRNVSSSL